MAVKESAQPYWIIKRPKVCGSHDSHIFCTFAQGQFFMVLDRPLSSTLITVANFPSTQDLFPVCTSRARKWAGRLTAVPTEGFILEVCACARVHYGDLTLDVCVLLPSAGLKCYYKSAPQLRLNTLTSDCKKKRLS